MIVISLYVEIIRIILFQMWHTSLENANTSEMNVISSLLFDDKFLLYF